MIHLIKDHNRHTQFVDFVDLTDDQISELLTIAKCRTRATTPSIEFPEGSKDEVIKYTALVEPKRFFRKNGERDLSDPKVLPFKVLGETILNAIAKDAQDAINAKLAKIEAGEAKAHVNALAEDADADEADSRDTHRRKDIDRTQKYLDAFKKAAKVLS